MNSYPEEAGKLKGAPKANIIGNFPCFFIYLFKNIYWLQSVHPLPSVGLLSIQLLLMMLGVIHVSVWFSLEEKWLLFSSGKIHALCWWGRKTKNRKQTNKKATYEWLLPEIKTIMLRNSKIWSSQYSLFCLGFTSLLTAAISWW